MIDLSQNRICDVCRILDFDASKKLCTYCKLCDAWICQQDISAWPRRFLAAAKRKLEFGYKGINNYEEVVKGANNESSTNNATNA